MDGLNHTSNVHTYNNSTVNNILFTNTDNP